MNDLTVIKKDGTSISCDHIQTNGNELLLMNHTGKESEKITKVHIEDVEIIASYYTDYNTIDHFRNNE